VNERIRELCIQSGAFEHYEINEGVDGDEIPMQRFAELIVQEVFEMIADEQFEMYPPVVQRVKERFGISDE
jgi:hypothetical protein